MHVTAHLGGGVGRVLSRVAIARAAQNAQIEEIFLCLEAPEKLQYVDVILDAGIKVVLPEDDIDVAELLASADIIQLEWWHHPLLVGWLCDQGEIDARIIVWAHTSGLHYPAFPSGFIETPHAFLFTSPVSMQFIAEDINKNGADNIMQVLHSSGGFEDFPQVERDALSRALNFGYLGSLNSAKLHPDILSYIEAVDIDGFKVDFYGDPDANPELTQNVKIMGLEARVCLKGYINQPEEAFAGMDVLVYLLNPMHYGTTENAILEAMASGVIPIVIGNQVEKTIVINGVTGFVINSPEEFKEAINFLVENPDERKVMAGKASEDIRRRFALEKTVGELATVYERVLETERRPFEFNQIFGAHPENWYLSCLGQYADIFEEHPQDHLQELPLPDFIFEESKSSIYHFLRYYPDDSGLKKLEQSIRKLAK